MNLKLPLVMLGAGGHAKVLLSLAQSAGWQVVGVCDPELDRLGVKEWRGIPVLGDDRALEKQDKKAIWLINGIGQLVGGQARQKAFETLSAQGFHFPVLIHPSAWVDSSVRLSDGVQVMAGAIVQADVEVGPNSIINTGASVDHDCRLAGNVHVAPGAILCGSVQVATEVFIGSGACIIQGVHVGTGAVVGAGVTLTRNLSDQQILLGPAARKKIAPAE